MHAVLEHYHLCIVSRKFPSVFLCFCVEFCAFLLVCLYRAVALVIICCFDAAWSVRTTTEVSRIPSSSRFLKNLPCRVQPPPLSPLTLLFLHFPSPLTYTKDSCVIFGTSNVRGKNLMTIFASKIKCHFEPSPLPRKTFL